MNIMNSVLKFKDKGANAIPCPDMFFSPHFFPHFWLMLEEEVVCTSYTINIRIGFSQLSKSKAEVGVDRQQGMHHVSFSSLAPI